VAAGSTYTSIATISAGGTTTATFTSIPSTYTDLVIAIGGAYSGTTYASFTFNGDGTSSNYSYTRLLGYSGGTLSDRSSGSDGFSLGSTRGTVIANVQNYSNSTTYKTMLVRENDGASAVGAYVYLWRNTAAITSIAITPKSSGTWTSGSVLTLYGIAAA
jgi:hypothetical protein